MVDALGKTEFENLGLQAPLQEILRFQSQDVIELHPVLIEHSNPHQSSEDGITLEQSSGILIVKGQQLSSSLSDLGKGVLDPPNLGETVVTPC